MLSGTLPESLSVLTALTRLQLSNNALTGSIPSGSMPALKALLLANNELSGSVPESLQNLTALT